MSRNPTHGVQHALINDISIRQLVRHHFFASPGPSIALGRSRLQGEFIFDRWGD
jgi:hypothetical protein